MIGLHSYHIFSANFPALSFNFNLILINLRINIFCTIFPTAGAITLRFELIEDPVGLNITIKKATTVLRRSLLGCFDECVRWQKWPPCQGILLLEEGICDLVSITDPHGEPSKQDQGQLYIRGTSNDYVFKIYLMCYLEVAPAHFYNVSASLYLYITDYGNRCVLHF